MTQQTCCKCDCHQQSTTGRILWMAETPKKEPPAQPEPSLWYPTIVTLVALALAVAAAWVSWKMGRLERKP